MKYRASATITLLVTTVFEHDGAHDLNDQAIEALDVEAQCCYCLKPGELKLNSMEIQKVEVERPIQQRRGRNCEMDQGWSR